MFSGITQTLGYILALQRQSHLLRYTVECPDFISESLKIGDSVSVDGVCQTVVECTPRTLTFEAMSETLRLTTLGALQPQNSVNLEHSIVYGQSIGGHLVSGHIQGKAQIIDRQDQAGQGQLTFQCPVEWMDYLPHKGFVAINGCSLTVTNPTPEGQFTVHFIPETLRKTNFPQKHPGEWVNIELDHQTRLIVDTVKRLLPTLLSRAPS